MSERVVISGTRRAMKELVDGTLRVQIDIDPEFKDDFHRLFSEIDMAVALAPLRLARLAQEEEHRLSKSEVVGSSPAAGSNWKNLGPLAQSAILVCKETRFQQFVAERIDNHSGFVMATEDECATYIKEECGVTTRKDLDAMDGARTKLGALMADYKEWQLHVPA